MIFLKILKNAEKCVFGRENRRRSNRERAPERVIVSWPQSADWEQSLRWIPELHGAIREASRQHPERTPFRRRAGYWTLGISYLKSEKSEVLY